MISPRPPTWYTLSSYSCKMMMLLSSGTVFLSSSICSMTSATLSLLIWNLGLHRFVTSHWSNLSWSPRFCLWILSLRKAFSQWICLYYRFHRGQWSSSFRSWIREWMRDLSVSSWRGAAVKRLLKSSLVHVPSSSLCCDSGSLLTCLQSAPCALVWISESSIALVRVIAQHRCTCYPLISFRYSLNCRGVACATRQEGDTVDYPHSTWECLPHFHVCTHKIDCILHGADHRELAGHRDGH